MSNEVRYTPATGDMLGLLAAHYDEPDVRRFLWDDEQVTVAMVEPVVAASDATFANHGWGLWLIESVPRHELVGTVALRNVPGHGDRVEVLYSLTRTWWGRGAATEAARMALRRGFEAGLAEVLGGVDDGNIRSVAVLHRLGMQAIGMLEVFGAPVRYYAVDRAAFHHIDHRP